MWQATINIATEIKVRKAPEGVEGWIAPYNQKNNQSAILLSCQFGFKPSFVIQLTLKHILVMLL